MPARDRPPSTNPLARAVDLHPAIAAWVAAIAALLVKHPGIATRSLWLDEAWTAAVGAHTLPAILNIAAHDQNPPLYNLLASWWMRVFGTSELALRVPSLLAAAACAALLLRFVRRFHGAEAAVTATLLYVVAPAQTWHATEARSYALVGLLCVASFHLYLSLLETPRRATAVALGVVNAAGLYVHYTIGLAWLAQAMCAPIVARAGDGRAALRAWLGSQLLAAALFVPFAPFLFANMPESATSWLPPPGLAELAQVVRELAGTRSALRAGALLVAGFAAWRILRWRRGDAPTLADRRLVAALAWAVVPVAVAFAVSQATPILLTRYELFAGLGWMVAVAAVVAALPWPPGARTVVALVMVALSAKATPYEAARDPAWRQVAALARPTPDDDTMLAVVPSVDCLPLAYYAAPDLLPTLFGPRGAWQPDGLHRRLAGRRILCRDGEWPASRMDLDGARVVLVLSRPSTDDAARALRHAAERGYVVESSRELAGKQIHVLMRPGAATKGTAP